jgi:hypothetical protein
VVEIYPSAARRLTRNSFIGPALDWYAFEIRSAAEMRLQEARIKSRGPQAALVGNAKITQSKGAVDRFVSLEDPPGPRGEGGGALAIELGRDPYPREVTLADGSTDIVWVGGMDGLFILHEAVNDVANYKALRPVSSKSAGHRMSSQRAVEKLARAVGKSDPWVSIGG